MYLETNGHQLNSSALTQTRGLRLRNGAKRGRRAQKVPAPCTSAERWERAMKHDDAPKPAFGVLLHNIETHHDRVAVLANDVP